MPSPCPQCGTLRARKISVCKNCGYDPATVEAAAAVASQPAQPVPPAQAMWPTICPRCGAPVNPGNTFCANCGLALVMPTALPAQKRPTKVLVIGGIAAVAVIALVGALALANRSKGWDPSNEPSPPDTWQSFTAPDGTWSVKFPGYLDPMTVSQSMDMGSVSMTLKMYLAMDGDAAYVAAAIDVPSSVTGLSSATALDQFQRGMFSASGGEITASRDLKVGSYDAREVKFSGVTASNSEGYARFWMTETRIFLLMVMATPGVTMYPEHFFDSFTMS